MAGKGIMEVLGGLFSKASDAAALKLVYRPKKPLPNQKVRVGKRPGTHGYTFEREMEAKGEGEICQVCQGSGKVDVETGNEQEHDLMTCPLCLGSGSSATKIHPTTDPHKETEMSRRARITADLASGKSMRVSSPATITPPAATQVQAKVRARSIVRSSGEVATSPPLTLSGGIYKGGRELSTPPPLTIAKALDPPVDAKEGDMFVNAETGDISVFRDRRWLRISLPASEKIHGPRTGSAWMPEPGITPFELDQGDIGTPLSDSMSSMIDPSSSQPQQEQNLANFKATAKKRKKESEW